MVGSRPKKQHPFPNNFPIKKTWFGYDQCSPKSAALPALGFAMQVAHASCSSGVFGSTVRANQNYLSLRGKGVQDQPWNTWQFPEQFAAIYL